MLDSPASSRPRVLYVDDQVGNLTVFRASLRRFADIRTATSATEALQVLQTEEFPVVISDQRMDGMTGSELLARVRELHPETQRVLLTAHADFGSVVEALNHGRIARFVRKPWRRAELQQVIEECSQQYHRSRERQALARQFLAASCQMVLSHAAAGLSEELQVQVGSLAHVDGLLDTWGICRGQSPEFDAFIDAVDRTRHLADALASHVSRANRAA